MLKSLARRRLMAVHRRLLKRYGEPARPRRHDPLGQLIGTILSQNTTDVNTARAYARLRERLPTWEAVRDAPEGEVAEAIRSAGLANTKAPRIQAILHQLTAERGRPTLAFLRGMPVEEGRAYLLSLKGVGPKTAAIVLLFSFGLDAFPVDTHIFRVTKRLGLIPAPATREQAHEILEGLAPPEVYYPLHLNLIRHGREICHARRPECEVCPLRDLCEYYQKTL